MMVFSFFSDVAACTNLLSITIKRICSIVGLTAFVLFAFMSILSLLDGAQAPW